MQQAKAISDAWTKAFLEPGFKLLFLLSGVLLGAVLWCYSGFIAFNETRQGFAFIDPYLAWFEPQDVTWLTFGVLYAALLGGIGVLVRYPGHLLLAVQTYTLVVIFRIAAMYALPLAPPTTTIPLADPFVQLFGSGEVLLQDLFFSGHTSTMFTLYLTAPTRRSKWILLLAVVVVAAAVLLQHVHYFVDVIAAPFFVYGSYALVRLLDRSVFGLELGRDAS